MNKHCHNWMIIRIQKKTHPFCFCFFDMWSEVKCSEVKPDASMVGAWFPVQSMQRKKAWYKQVQYFADGKWKWRSERPFHCWTTYMYTKSPLSYGLDTTSLSFCLMTRIGILEQSLRLKVAWYGCWRFYLCMVWVLLTFLHTDRVSDGFTCVRTWLWQFFSLCFDFIQGSFVWIRSLALLYRSISVVFQKFSDNFCGLWAFGSSHSSSSSIGSQANTYSIIVATVCSLGVRACCLFY